MLLLSKTPTTWTEKEWEDSVFVWEKHYKMSYSAHKMTLFLLHVVRVLETDKIISSLAWSGSQIIGNISR